MGSLGHRAIDETDMSTAFAPPWVRIRSDLGVSGTAAGLIITAHSLAIAVSSPLVGWLIDRLGVRPVLSGGLVLYGIAGAPV
jgi:ACDE family multidrug resistance protein